MAKEAIVYRIKQDAVAKNEIETDTANQPLEENNVVKVEGITTDPVEESVNTSSYKRFENTIAGALFSQLFPQKERTYGSEYRIRYPDLLVDASLFDLKLEPMDAEKGLTLSYSVNGTSHQIDLKTLNQELENVSIEDLEDAAEQIVPAILGQTPTMLDSLKERLTKPFTEGMPFAFKVDKRKARTYLTIRSRNRRSGRPDDQFGASLKTQVQFKYLKEESVAQFYELASIDPQSITDDYELKLSVEAQIGDVMICQFTLEHD